MKRTFFALGLGLIPALVACAGDGPSGSGGAGGGVARTIGLGGHSAARLFDDGTLEVEAHGSILIKRDKPIFGVFKADRKDFHDPATRDRFEFEPLDATAVEMTGEPETIHLKLKDQGKDAALVTFQIPTDQGAYLGLGERFDHVNARGAIVPMFLAVQGSFESGTNDAHVPVPLVIDSLGYGVMVASPATGAFDVGATDPGTLVATFDQTDLDVRIYVPGSSQAVNVPALYQRDTGKPRRPPLWSLAPMHWRNEWPDAATLLADLDAYRARHIPASTVWIDNPWQTSYNDATLDPARFGDTAALMKAIAAKGFKTIAWSTPYLDRPTGAPENEAQRLWQEADEKGFLVKADGKSWDAVGCCVKNPGMIDFTNPKASAFWEGVVGRAVDAGFSGFKLDYGEDLLPTLLGVRLQVQLEDGGDTRTARTYPLGYHAAYEAALAKAKRSAFVIGRASGIGGGAHVDAIWPGDLDNGFQKHDAKHVGGLPAAIVAGQTLAASGFPTFGSDIGGFRDGMPKREALLRWAEYAAFGVIMELGGGGESHNPWAYDEEAAKIYGKLARAHLQLVPYLDALFAAAEMDGRPPILSLPLFFQQDPKAIAFADSEYLLGTQMLVAPVVEAGASSRQVYLPDIYVHWFTHELFESVGRPVTVEAPLGTPPVFVRQGSLIPMFGPKLDTLVPASEPGIVDLGADVDEEVRWVPNTSLELSADWPNGDHLETRDRDLMLAWKGGNRGLIVVVELALMRTDLTKVAATGATKVASEDQVRAAKGSAFAVDLARKVLFVRVAPNRTLRFAAN